MSMVFDNYELGVQSSSVNHKCSCESCEEIVSVVTKNSVKDKYGNIISLNWIYGERFTLKLTSDIFAPIVPGSVVLTNAGEVPTKDSGVDGMYTYNTTDFRCWKFIDGSWVESSDIKQCECGEVLALFSNKNSSTKVLIKNFRGDVIHSVESDNNEVSISIDESIDSVIGQGFYVVEIYTTSCDRTRFIRRIPLTVG